MGWSREFRQTPSVEKMTLEKMEGKLVLEGRHPEHYRFPERLLVALFGARGEPERANDGAEDRWTPDASAAGKLIQGPGSSWMLEADLDTKRLAPGAYRLVVGSDGDSGLSFLASAILNLV
jgi:hypothetical protein